MFKYQYINPNVITIISTATKPTAIVQTDCKVGNSSIKHIHISTVQYVISILKSLPEVSCELSWLPCIAFPFLLLHPLMPSAFQQCINNFVLPWFNVTYTRLMDLYGQFCSQRLTSKGCKSMRTAVKTWEDAHIKRTGVLTPIRWYQDLVVACNFFHL